MNQRSSKSHSCRLCGNTTGKCEDQGQIINCMELVDARPGDKVRSSDGQEYVFRKISSNDLWGVWGIPASDKGFNRDYIHKPKAAQKRTVEVGNSAAWRDAYYRKFLSGRAFDAEDLQDLRRRGLTETQIHKSGVKSGRIGYIFPIKNVDGLIVGAQWRIRHPEEDQPRYVWHNIEGGKHIPDTKELPLSVFRKESNVVNLVEGTGVKPFLLSERTGQTTIGAAGGMFASSKKTLQKSLTKLKPEKIVFYPDAGCVENSQILRQYERTFEALDSLNHPVQVAWWGQVDKTHPDADELEDFSLVQLLSLDEFWAFVPEENRPQSFEIEHDDRLPNYDLSLPVDVACSGKYLQVDISQIPPDAKLIILKAPMGSGKTQLLSALADEFKVKGWPLNVLSYREQLGMQIGTRLNLPYKSEGSKDLRATLGNVRCIDSCRPQADPPMPQDGKYALAIDEVENTIWTALHGSTNIERRLDILHTLEAILSNLAQEDNPYPIILGDADLSDLSIEFILSLAGNFGVKTYVIESTYKPAKGWDVYSYDDPSSLFTQMSHDIVEGHHFIMTSGQKVDSKWGAQTMEMFLNEKFPEKKVIRIDSASISDPSHPAYRFLSLDKEAMHSELASYDVVIASPVIESGCSVELYDHFDACWGYFTGAIPENSVRQFMGRIRDGKVPRHIYVSERGLPGTWIGNGETDPSELLKNQIRESQDNLKFISPMLLDALGTDGTFGGIHLFTTCLEFWAAFGARINQGWHRYRESVLYHLQKSGHTIHRPPTQLDREQAKQVSKVVGQMRDDNTERENAAIAEARILEKEDYSNLSEKKELTREDRRAVKAYEVAQRFGVEQKELSTELVEIDRSGGLKFWRTHYYLTVGKEFVQARDTAAIDNIKHKETVWVPDVNRKTISRKMRALKEVGIDSILERAQAGESFYGSMPEIERVKKLALHPKTKDQFKNLFRVEVTEDNSALAIVQEILAQAIGFRLEKGKKKTIDGRQQHLYEFKHPEDWELRSRTFEKWRERDLKKASQNELTPFEAPTLIPQIEEVELATKHSIDLIATDGSTAASEVQDSKAKTSRRSKTKTDGLPVQEFKEVTPSANEDLEIFEHDGFKVGDAVRITLKNFDKQDQKEIRKNKEVEEGAVGRIIRFVKSGISDKIKPVIQFVNEVKDLNSVWLEKCESEPVFS